MNYEQVNQKRGDIKIVNSKRECQKDRGIVIEVKEHSIDGQYVGFKSKCSE